MYLCQGTLKFSVAVHTLVDNQRSISKGLAFKQELNKEFNKQLFHNAFISF